MSLSGETVLVGAPEDEDTGKVFVMDLAAAARYCVGAPNSVGPSAFFGTNGTTHVSHDNLLLLAAGAPAGQFGLFYYGPEAVQVPFGDGYRCVGGGATGLFRLNPPAQIDGSGAAGMTPKSGPVLIRVRRGGGACPSRRREGCPGRAPGDGASAVPAGHPPANPRSAGRLSCRP